MTDEVRNINFAGRWSADVFQGIVVVPTATDALDLFQQPPESLLRFAALSAGVKFLLLGTSALYALAVGVRRVLGR